MSGPQRQSSSNQMSASEGFQTTWSRSDEEGRSRRSNVRRSAHRHHWSPESPITSGTITPAIGEHSPVLCFSKERPPTAPSPAAIQQQTPGSPGQQGGPPSSRLPVKGLPTILHCSSPARDIASAAPPIKSKAPPLQSRTTSTAGLKAPTVPAHCPVRTTHSSARTAHLGGKTTPTVCAKQKSGTIVDKNKPREASTTNSPQIRARTQNLHPPPQVSEPSRLSLTSPPKPGGDGFKSRTGPRSSPKPSPQTVSQSIESGRGQASNGRGQARLTQIREQEKKNQVVLQLKRLLLQNNRRTEALAAVLQYQLTQQEEASKQRTELLLKLGTLREELDSSSWCLQQEKEDALRSLQENHKEELREQEDRLRRFYQGQWDQVQQVYQKEAERYRLEVETQVEELRNKHSETIETLKQQYDSAVCEMKELHQTELANIQKNLKAMETTLSRDTHTVYLQQELDSLKVVLEMRSTQLQHKERRLMELEQLVETKVELEENLKKVQQENELYRVRMDQQTALSRQLCSEQAVLQQSLQKESKVNKRLSMENEELLWKLTNADLLSSPRRLSPSSHLGSTTNSASFPTAASLSPR